MKRPIPAILLSVSLTALLAGNARAQIDYDPANHAYFVTDWAFLNTNISGNDVFVGKDNATNFATLPFTLGLQIMAGANITQFGNTYAGTSYQGLNVFGAHTVLVQGGNVSTATAFDTSTMTITGGTVTGASAGGASILNLNGGTVSSFTAFDNGTVNLKSGTLNGFMVGGNSTVNMTGGTVTFTAQVVNSSKVNVTGGIISNASISGGTLNVGNGGRVNSANATGGAINVTGGNVGNANGEWFTAINVSGGTVGAVYGNRGSVVHISEGTVNHADAHSSSTLNVSGGEVNEAHATLGSRMDITGGRVRKATASSDSWIHVRGGLVDEFIGSTITVANSGSVGFVTLHPNGTMYVTGGNGGWVNGGANSTVNVSGGFLDSASTELLNVTGGKVFLTFSNRVNITGGLVSQANARSKMNISGGTVVRPEVDQNIPVNISGGTVGGFGTEENTGSFPTERGIYQIAGTLNLYGSGFTRTNIVPGDYQYGGPGTYSTLTGTLLDGTPVNSLFFLGDGATVNFRGGASQGNAIMPNSISNGTFTFTDVPSSAWFDPPIVDTYLFTMTDSNFFTGILDFPTGFNAPFEVRVGNVLLGAFGAGQAVNFADFGFGNGVSAFTISNITPGTTWEDPTGFPIRLGFSAPFASFTMQGSGANVAAAPEPGTFALLAIGCVGFATYRCIRRHS